MPKRGCPSTGVLVGGGVFCEGTDGAGDEVPNKSMGAPYPTESLLARKGPWAEKQGRFLKIG